MAKEKEKRRYYSDAQHPPKVKLVCKEPSRTRQSEAEKADINVIVKRFLPQGMVSLNSQPGLFLDVSEMGDYREALEQVRQGEMFFRALPSDVRSRFRNSPAEFLDFVSNPENKAEMASLGLLGEVEPGKAPEASPEAVKGS